MEKRKWTQEEIRKIKELLQKGICPGDIALILNRSEKSVRIMAGKLKISIKGNKKTEFLDKTIYSSALFKCPFYLGISQSKLMLKCEGDEGKYNIILVFEDENELKKHIKYCCSMSYSLCPIAELLLKKYES